MRPSISILIRTFNSGRALPVLLKGLRLEDQDEILVVDSGSTDRTIAIAERHGARIIRVEPPFNYSKSLNRGFEVARGLWVLVISSHSVPLVPDLLETYRQAIADLPSEVPAAYGISRSDPCSRSEVDQVTLFDQSEISRFDSSCANTNAIYRHSAWKELPFNEEIRTAEDKIWLFDQLARGRRMAIVPGARVLNRNRYSLAYMMRKGYSEARSFPNEPVGLFGLLLKIRALLKSVIFFRMPLGNFFRISAYFIGHAVGTHAPPGNDP